MTDETPTNLPAVRDLAPLQTGGALLDTNTFEQLQRTAKALQSSTILPPAIQGPNERATFSNLMIVFSYAYNWGIEPMAVAQCTSIIYGKLVFEGKLVAAVLEGHGVDLDYVYTGDPEDGDNYAIEVIGERHGKKRSIKGKVGDWKTFEKNGDLKDNWKPHNATMQLAYRGARQWCRLWYPALLLGVYAEDEIDLLTMAGTGPARNHAKVTPATLSSGFDEDISQAEDAEFDESDMTAEEEEMIAPRDPPTEEEEEIIAERKKAAEKPAESDSDDKASETPDEPETAVSEDPEPEADDAWSGETWTRPPELKDYPQIGAWWDYWLAGDRATWGAVKKAFAEMSAGEDWKRASKVPGQELLSRVRAAIFFYFGNTDTMMSDPTMYRCYVEFATDPDELMQSRDNLGKTELWASMTETQQKIIDGSVVRRIASLKGISDGE